MYCSGGDEAGYSCLPQVGATGRLRDLGAGSCCNQQGRTREVATVNDAVFVGIAADWIAHEATAPYVSGVGAIAIENLAAYRAQI